MKGFWLSSFTLLPFLHTADSLISSLFNDFINLAKKCVFFFYPQLDLVNILQISIGMDSSTLGCLENEEKMTFIKDKSERVPINAGLRSHLKITSWMSACVARHSVHLRSDNLYN